MTTKVKDIPLDQLTGMRETSQKVSQTLHGILATHLKTLTPLFAPRKVLGEYMESAFKDKVPGADKTFAKLEAQYKELCQAPFDIPPKLGTPIPNIKNQLTIQPWCYPYTIGDLELNVRSPVRWVLGYAAAYDLNRLMQSHMSKERPRPEDVKTLLLTTLTMAYLLDMSPGLKELVAGLNFSLTIEHAPIAGTLPFAVVSAPIRSFRPQDDMMKIVAQLSGTPVFEELVDVEEIAALEHPFKTRLTPLLGA
jgi:hypothetical protein